MKEILIHNIQQSVQTKMSMLSNDALLDELCSLAKACIFAIAKGNKIIFCGNGGSAADAQHMAAEFVVRFAKNREALPAISLTTDTSVLTAIGNDFGFENIFSRQIEAIGKPGDILIGITTSGTSANVLNAFDTAMDRGLTAVAFTKQDTDLSVH